MQDAAYVRSRTGDRIKFLSANPDLEARNRQEIEQLKRELQQQQKTVETRRRALNIKTKERHKEVQNLNKVGGIHFPEVLRDTRSRFRVATLPC